MAATPLHANNTPSFQFIPLDTVLFDTGKADLKSDAKTLLDDIAKYLRNNLALQRVLIEGHADETGHRNKNYQLSDRRATAVRDYLVEKGVPVDLIQLTGRGENQPVDEAWSRSGRERNRHVEIYAVMRE
jgi:outer membrane protein OmpA-like peptidoglycan-associated protein